MSKIDLLIRELRMELPITVISELEPIFAKYATKQKPRIPGSRAFARTDKHIPKVRKKPRKGKQTREEIAEVRHMLFLRANGFCEAGDSPKCMGKIPENMGEAAHIKSKARGGRFELSNLLWKCGPCHRYEHNGGKPIKVTKREATKGNQ